MGLRLVVVADAAPRCSLECMTADKTNVIKKKNIIKKITLFNIAVCRAFQIRRGFEGYCRRKTKGNRKVEQLSLLKKNNAICES